MPASKQEIDAWFDEGVQQQATHMIVICDTFSYEDYPVYVPADEPVADVLDRYDGAHMKRVMEVYNLRAEKVPQLKQLRAYNL